MEIYLQQLPQQLINGLTLGGVYALIAIGYSMVYGILGMLNFAHGEVYMIGGFAGWVWKTGCRSWYLDRNGVPMAWPWTFDRFVEEMRSPKPDDFDLR